MTRNCTKSMYSLDESLCVSKLRCLMVDFGCFELLSCRKMNHTVIINLSMLDMTIYWLNTKGFVHK